MNTHLFLEQCYLDTNVVQVFGVFLSRLRELGLGVFVLPLPHLQLGALVEVLPLQGVNLGRQAGAQTLRPAQLLLEDERFHP